MMYICEEKTPGSSVLLRYMLRTAAIDTSLEMLLECNNQVFSVPVLMGHQVKLEVQYQLQRAYEGK